jgi:hypothetical protein
VAFPFVCVCVCVFFWVSFWWHFVVLETAARRGREKKEVGDGC